MSRDSGKGKSSSPSIANTSYNVEMISRVLNEFESQNVSQLKASITKYIYNTCELI